MQTVLAEKAGQRALEGPPLLKAKRLLATGAGGCEDDLLGRLLSLGGEVNGGDFGLASSRASGEDVNSLPRRYPGQLVRSSLEEIEVY